MTGYFVASHGTNPLAQRERAGVRGASQDKYIFNEAEVS